MRQTRLTQNVANPDIMMIMMMADPEMEGTDTMIPEISDDEKTSKKSRKKILLTGGSCDRGDHPRRAQCLSEYGEERSQKEGLEGG